MTKINDIKKEIKKLRKSLNDYASRSKERKEVKERIIELKAQIKALEQVDEQKRPIVEAILKLDDSFAKLNINLYKHDIEALKKHLKNLQTKGV